MLASALSLLRFLLALLTFHAILQNKFKIALALIVLAALTDFLDGWVARKLNQKTEIGAHLDHIGDKVFVLIALVAFYMKSFVGFLPLFLLLLREVAITLLRFQGLAAPVNYIGKLKTVVEFFSLTFLCVDPKLGNFLLWLSVLLAYLSAYLYVSRPISV